MALFFTKLARQSFTIQAPKVERIDGHERMVAAAVELKAVDNFIRTEDQNEIAFLRERCQITPWAIKEMPTDERVKPVNEGEWTDYHGFMKMGFRAGEIAKLTQALEGSKPRVQMVEQQGKKWYSLRDIGGIIEERRGSQEG